MAYINPNVVVVALLNADPTVASLTSGRVWSPRINTAVYDPTVNGGGISLSVRGGKVSLYDPIVEPSFTVTAWGSSPDQAGEVMAAVLQALHDIPDQKVQCADGLVRVMSGVCEVFPQDVTDSETGWPTCVSFFRVKMNLSGTQGSPNLGTYVPTTGGDMPQQLLTKAAGTAISAMLAVHVRNGLVFVADPAVQPPIAASAIAANSGLTGEAITLQNGGELVNSTWSWVPDMDIYVGPGGMLTQTPPSEGYIQNVGVPTGPTSMLVEVQEPSFF